jgi:hypothetical protein
VRSSTISRTFHGSHGPWPGSARARSARVITSESAGRSPATWHQVRTVPRLAPMPRPQSASVRGSSSLLEPAATARAQRIEACPQLYVRVASIGRSLPGGKSHSTGKLAYPPACVKARLPPPRSEGDRGEPPSRSTCGDAAGPAHPQQQAFAGQTHDLSPVRPEPNEGAHAQGHSSAWCGWTIKTKLFWESRTIDGKTTRLSREVRPPGSLPLWAVVHRWGDGCFDALLDADYVANVD